MTNDELNTIVAAVIQALKTNSKTISQLTPVSALSDDDSIEIGGGKRVTYAVLKSLIEVLYSAAIESGINANNEIYFEGSKLKMSAVPDELNAALNQYFDQCVKKDSDNLVDLLYTRIVLLDSMGSNLDGLTYTPVAGDLVWRNGYVFQWDGSSWGEGIPPRKHVEYINKHTGKRYMWTGTTMQELQGSSSSDTGSISAFSDYAVAQSVSALPAQGVATTGYIVGSHIYAYVGTGGDTANGKYQDLGELNASGVSLTTNGDGTFTVHVGDTDYTVNLNHTHPNMAKLVVCEESDLPSTYDNDTIYAITDSGETEIEKLIIHGLEFVGGGAAPGVPTITKPSGTTLNLGENSGSGVSKQVEIKGVNLTGDLTVTVGTGLTISYGNTTGASSVTIPVADATVGAMVTIAYSGSGALADGSLSITGGGAQAKSITVVVTEPQWTDVDLSQLPLVYAWIGSSGSYDVNGQTAYSGLLDVTGASEIKITANSSAKTFFIFLKQNPHASAGNGYAQDLCANETGRREVAVGQTSTLQLPSDCVYVMIGYSSSGSNPQWQPSYVGIR